MGGFYSGGLPVTGPADSPEQLPDPFFAAGTWNISATGESVIAPFQLSFRLPPLILWTNRESLSTISRNSDVTVTWYPSGYLPSDIMSVTVSAATILPGTVGISCRAPAVNRTVVLPQSLLQRVSPTPAGVITIEVSPRVSDSPHFQVPFTDKATGPGWITYSVREMDHAVIQ